MLANKEPASDLKSKGDVLVIYNPYSGNKKANSQNYLDDIQNSLITSGFVPKVVTIENLEKIASSELPVKSLVIVVGGDGTVRSTVEKFIDCDITLGIIPSGTYNHLAKDLKIPLTIADSVAVIAKGHTKKIDIAQVNGSIFLNNSSIGLYTKAVKYRRLYNKWFKWLAMTFATLNVFKDLPLFKVNYHFEGTQLEVVTPLVFISNNEYELELLKLTQRNRLDQGDLYLYINQSRSHGDFIKLLFDVLLRRKKRIRGKFTIEAIRSCQLNFQKKYVDVAVDGEVKCMDTPLSYKIQPKKLTIILPEEGL